MRIGSSLVALAIAASVAASASAAVIQLTGGDAGEGLTLNPADAVYALDINGNNGAGYTVQGVKFLPSYPNVSTINGGNFAVGASSFPGTSANDIALAQVFNTLNYADGGNYATITTTFGGLTPGSNYQVNILVSLGDFVDLRHEEFLLNGVLTGDTLDYPTGQYFNVSAVGAANESGQLIIGVHDNTPANAGGGAIVNGIVISAVPEPASLGLLGLGVLALVRRRRA